MVCGLMATTGCDLGGASYLGRIDEEREREGDVEARRERLAGSSPEHERG
jgi:hypothetical protein